MSRIRILSYPHTFRLFLDPDSRQVVDTGRLRISVGAMYELSEYAYFVVLVSSSAMPSRVLFICEGLKNWHPVCLSKVLRVRGMIRLYGNRVEAGKCFR